MEKDLIVDVTSKLLRASSSAEILEIINTNGYGSIEKLSDAILMIGLLANEIRVIKSSLISQKLLIEHEEVVRTTKAVRKPAAKNIPLVFKNGDFVARVKTKDNQGTSINGKVVKVAGGRVKVLFADHAVWVEARSLVHSKVA